VVTVFAQNGLEVDQCVLTGFHQGLKVGLIQLVCQFAVQVQALMLRNHHLLAQTDQFHPDGVEANLDFVPTYFHHQTNSKVENQKKTL
jgi:hypothetical protein